MSFLVYIRNNVWIKHSSLSYTYVTLSSLTHLAGTLQNGPLIRQIWSLMIAVDVVPNT